MCQQEKIPPRILIWFGGTKIPKMFTDWYDFADYLKQEELAGREVVFKKWEYV